MLKVYLADVFGDKIYENVLYATYAYDERYVFTDGKWLITKQEWLYHIKKYDVDLDENETKLLNIVVKQVEKEKALTIYKYKEIDYKKIDSEKVFKMQEAEKFDEIEEYYKSAEIEVKIKTSTLEDIYKYLSTLTPKQRNVPVIRIWDESGDTIPVKDVSKLFEIENGAISL